MNEALANAIVGTHMLKTGRTTGRMEAYNEMAEKIANIIIANPTDPATGTLRELFDYIHAKAKECAES